MWNLYEQGKKLEPLVFSNKKTQESIIQEVVESIKEGHRIIFIKGFCGSGKSAIALNLARIFGKTSLVVPIKSLQEQYINDYSEKKYVLKNGKKLEIHPILGRANFKCKFLENEKNNGEMKKRHMERNAKLSDIFFNKGSSFDKKFFSKEKDNSCDNLFLPCKIEIKEKNLDKIRKFINRNPNIKFSDFNSINQIKRSDIASICPYWSPILSEDVNISSKIFHQKKIKYLGLNNKDFVIYQRKKGCKYYDQYEFYKKAEVLIFNSEKYKIENLMDRKPKTELEIIDECDDFLDNLGNEENFNVTWALSSLSNLFLKNEKIQKFVNELISILNFIKNSKKFKKIQNTDKILSIKDTAVENFLNLIIKNPELIEEIENDETTYFYHLIGVARVFSELFDETYFSISKKENDLIINLVNLDLAKKLKEIISKNKIFIFMSATIHSPEVLKNIFGIEDYKLLNAEIEPQGELIKCKYGYEFDCKYSNFKTGKKTRKDFLLSFSKAVECSKKPLVVQLTSFSDLPDEREKQKYSLDNLPARAQLINFQRQDPLGKIVQDFKNKKIEVLFTTKCNRGIDFPGEICNTIIITRFPYPNISSIFWRLLKQTKPTHFRSFYIDKAKRELLQRIYRGLRSKKDKLYLLSPDIRVLNFNIK